MFFVILLYIVQKNSFNTHWYPVSLDFLFYIGCLPSGLYIVLVDRGRGRGGGGRTMTESESKIGIKLIFFHNW